MKRFVISTLAVLIVVAGASVAGAQSEEGGETEGGGETVVVEEPEFEGEPPAVVIPPEVESTEDEPWTIRYLVPALVVIGVLMVVGLGVAYYFRVKARYKVVE